MTDTAFVPAIAPGWVRRNRGAVALAFAVVAVLALLASLTVGGKSGPLDPDAYDPSGAHAISVLLQERGVAVHRTTDLPQTQALADSRSTVFVPLPDLLSNEELQALADLPSDLVIAGADPLSLGAVDDSIDVARPVRVKTRSAGCSWAVATNAGRAEVGGYRYHGGTDSCYGSSLVRLPSRQLVLLGDPELMVNDHLAHEGNAALAIGLLGQQPSLLWLVPDPNRPVIGDRPVQDPNDLLPDWVGAATTQLLVALTVLALWRARRLGRVVPEPLPVVVRAAETIEGRGRLYRAAHARRTAADELRAGIRARLGPRVGAGRNPAAETLVAAVAGHTGRTAEEVTALLYGPQPADDGALVRLADDLDALTREVTGS